MGDKQPSADPEVERPRGVRRKRLRFVPVVVEYSGEVDLQFHANIDGVKHFRRDRLTLRRGFEVLKQDSVLITDDRPRRVSPAGLRVSWLETCQLPKFLGRKLAPIAFTQIRENPSRRATGIDVLISQPLLEHADDFLAIQSLVLLVSFQTCQNPVAVRETELVQSPTSPPRRFFSVQFRAYRITERSFHFIGKGFAVSTAYHDRVTAGKLAAE